MEQCYAVTVYGIPVGKVIVRRQGLYYHIACRCHMKGETIHRLVVTSGSTNIILGIVVPNDDGFTLNTKIPVKKIGEGDMSFTLCAKKMDFSGTFIPISPEEPFSYISRLKDSFLVMQNGYPGILVNKMQEQ